MEKFRTYVITGASKGIGLATARQLQREGHRVIGLARSTPSDVNGFLEFVEVDLADETARVAAIHDLVKRYQVDGILNNVGLVKPAPLDEITLSDFDEVLDVNVRCALQLTQAVLPGMKERN